MSTENTAMPTVLGALEIVSGVSGMMGSLPIVWIALAALGIGIPNAPPEAELPISLAASFLLILGGTLFCAGVVALIGGIRAIQRRGFGWPIAGAIASVFAFAPLGIMAIILAVISQSQLAANRPMATSG